MWVRLTTCTGILTTQCLAKPKVHVDDVENKPALNQGATHLLEEGNVPLGTKSTNANRSSLPVRKPPRKPVPSLIAEESENIPPLSKETPRKKEASSNRRPLENLTNRSAKLEDRHTVSSLGPRMKNPVFEGGVLGGKARVAALPEKTGGSTN